MTDSQAQAQLNWCIVGGAGFIGSHLVSRLLTEDRAERVVVLDNLSSGSRELLNRALADSGLTDDRVELIVGDCGDAEVAMAALEGADVVVHLASNPDIARAVTEPEVDFVSGTRLTNAVVEAARRQGVGTVVYASGSGVYGDLGDLPLPEDFGPLRPVSTYGASKLAGESLVCSYAHMFGLRGRAFRFANVVGPRQTHGVGFDFLAKLEADPTRLQILGDGRQSKCYIAVTDVLAAILAVLDAPDDAPYEIYNVSTDDALSVDDIAVAACVAAGLDPAEVRFEHTGGRGGWNGDVPVVRLDTGRIRALGWQPKRSSAEAMDWALAALSGVAPEPTDNLTESNRRPVTATEPTAGATAEGPETHMADDQQPPLDAEGASGSKATADKVEPDGSNQPAAGTDPPASDDALTQSEKRLLMGLGAAAVVVLLIILAVNVLSGGDDDSSTGDTKAAAGAEQATETTTNYGPSAEAFGTDGGVADTPPNLSSTSDPISDDFARNGLSGGDLGWKVVGEGDWEVNSGQLTVATEPASVSPLAVTEVPGSVGSDWNFSITIDKRANGAGLVWGVEDDQNYWEMRVNLDFAAVVINHVKDGKPEQVQVIGPAGVGDGQRLTVQHIGDTVTLAGSGKPFFAMSDPSLVQPRRVGVIAPSGSGVSFSEAAVAKIDAPS